MRLRLYHHHDGARVAYRETGTGPPLVLLHSLGLSHREWEPIVDAAVRALPRGAARPALHGDSEDRPRHPYTPDWLADVIAGFCREVGGPRPLARRARHRRRARAEGGEHADGSRRRDWC